jgi:hypothetical protein
MRHNYAMSGSSCSSAVVGGFLPGILENQVPSFEGDLKLPGFLELPPKDTVYAIWIGTNDLGFAGFLPQADGQAKVPKYVECVWTVFDKMYAAGGRKFLLMNIIPLNLLPIYTTGTGKRGDSMYPNPFVPLVS